MIQLVPPSFFEIDFGSQLSPEEIGFWWAFYNRFVGLMEGSLTEKGESFDARRGR